jgi:hypothetical protein
MKRSEVIGMVRPENPIEFGEILGSLEEHIAEFGRDYSALVLTDAVIHDYLTGGRSEVEDVQVYHRQHIRFRFRRGDRVLLALGDGQLGKVWHGGRVVWENEFPDGRLSLVHLLQRWYPEWSPPADMDPWTDERTKVACPLSPHADRPARLCWTDFSCSRHTRSEVWSPIDVMVRRLGFVSEEAALGELSRIEDERLAALAKEV